MRGQGTLQTLKIPISILFREFLFMRYTFLECSTALSCDKKGLFYNFICAQWPGGVLIQQLLQGTKKTLLANISLHPEGIILETLNGKSSPDLWNENLFSNRDCCRHRPKPSISKVNVCFYIFILQWFFFHKKLIVLVKQ